MQSILARLAAIAALACSAAAATGQTVTPPPRTPGFDRIRPEAGLDEDERKRYVRAHHHKMHHKKDYTRDDSVFEAGDGHPHGNKPATASGQAKNRKK